MKVVYNSFLASIINLKMQKYDEYQGIIGVKPQIFQGSAGVEPGKTSGKDRHFNPIYRDDRDKNQISFFRYASKAGLGA